MSFVIDKVALIEGCLRELAMVKQLIEESNEESDLYDSIPE
jgi:hypothetical protein